MRRQRGFTLMELLIAISVVALLAILVFIGLKTQIARGYDAKRKSDLSAIHKAFEEYYNDNDCYPASGILDTCGATALSPYLAKIPCDPVTKVPYKYVPESNACNGFRVCATLGDTGDSDITRIGCHPTAGCGWGAGYNFCQASGVPITAPGFDPNISPTPTSGPTPSPTPGGGPTATPTPTPPGGGGSQTFACTPGGQCNIYADPEGSGCPVTFSDPTCNNACSDPANRCLQ